MKKICLKLDLAYPVTLIQNGKRFTVQYGDQVKKDLTYAEAGEEYGSCIMHALTCDGLIDNQE